MFEFLRDWLGGVFGESSLLVSFIIKTLYVLFWLAVGIGLSLIIKPAVHRFLRLNAKIAKKIQYQKNIAYSIVDYQKRGETVAKALVNILGFVLWFIIIMIVLAGFNVDTSPILASAGVVGIAVAFGTQTIIKDFVSGVFIIMENTFSIGELVKISDFTGTVKEIGLRTTKIEGWMGDYFIINNGSIGPVINYSRDSSTAIVDVLLGTDLDYELFESKIKAFLTEYKVSNPAMIEPLTYIGMIETGPNFVKVRIIGKCKPAEHFAFERLLRNQIFTFCQTNGFKIPIQEIHIVGETSHGNGH